MGYNISQNIEVKPNVAAVSAGTDGDWVAGAEIDTLDCDSVAIVASLGTVTSTGVFEMRVRGSNTSGSYGSGTTGLLEQPDGTTEVQTAASAGSNKNAVIEVAKPQYRYIKPEYKRTVANVVIKHIVSVARKNQAIPTTDRAVAPLVFNGAAISD